MAAFGLCLDLGLERGDLSGLDAAVSQVHGKCFSVDGITVSADVTRITSTTGYREYLSVITSRYSPVVYEPQKSILRSTMGLGVVWTC